MFPTDLLFKAAIAVSIFFLGIAAGAQLSSSRVSAISKDLGKAVQSRDACIAAAKEAATMAETRAKTAAAAVEEARKGKAVAEAEIARIRAIRPGNDACAAALKLNRDIVASERRK